MKQFWISRLSRDTLQELNFDSHRALVGSQMQPFPNVHTLKMDDFPNSIDDTIAILNKFPNLRTFSSSYRRRVLSNLTPAEVLSIFPVLQEYTGARENLHIFVQPLLPVPSPHSDPFSGTELNALFTFFPNLNELRLVLVRMIEGNRSTSQATFLNMLASSPLLPRTLRSLSIEWDCSQYDSSDSETEHVLAAPDPADAPDFAILRPQLTARCPALTEIFLDGYHFLFWWRKTWSVWEATVHTYDDAKFLRAQKYDTCPS
ncbi:hypothetical protein MSAN_00750000 [Mycena sanguinolenta]|uniref:Uncharacterized protein n=1 Tax=Mycena sanguinolenta TaxID=230812 RepID=A0A8H6Z6C2_9AGAR|nr:hypothetical protein MSAN_00750000 [Mycena sanguinolenta]